VRAGAVINPIRRQGTADGREISCELIRRSAHI
jgi:hypothetical protein